MANTKTKWTEKVSKVLFKSKNYKDHIYLANETKLNEKNYTRRIIKRIYFRTKTRNKTDTERQRKRKGKSNQTKWQKGQESGAKVENKKVVKNSVKSSRKVRPNTNTQVVGKRRSCRRVRTSLSVEEASSEMKPGRR